MNIAAKPEIKNIFIYTLIITITNRKNENIVNISKEIVYKKHRSIQVIVI